MRIRKIDRRLEKDILIGMITDRDFLARLRNTINFAFFKNSYCRTVAKWVVDFYDKYGHPPFNEIENIYEYHKREGELDDEEDVDLIKNLLESAAEQYSDSPCLNSQFLLEKAQEYFNKVNMELTFARAQEMIERGQVNEARDLLLEFKSVKIGETEATDGLVDEAELQAAFADTEKPLFSLPGDIGRMLNSELARDKFIVLQAPEKTGKTWFLLWMALRALRARLKVVMFELEMTKNQVNRRMSISISGKSDQKRYCDGKNIPRKFIQGGTPVDSLPADIGIQYEDIEEYEPLIWQTALEHNQKFYEHFHIKKDKHWRLITAPARSINIRQIDAELDRLEKEEGFVADVVLIDYMDILGAENSREQERERINSNWVAAKALCNKRHCCLLSVTQANAQAYEQDLQTRSSFSEDHRKYAHTNGTLGLTQTPQDKKAGIAKLNWLVLREGEFNERDVCYVLQCLKRGKFCVDSMTLEGFNSRNRGGNVKKQQIIVDQPNQETKIKRTTRKR